MNIYRSKFTPGVKAKDVCFAINEVVSYRMRNGETHKITIRSDKRKHAQAGLMGYEARFDDGDFAFAAEDGIYDWEGKC